MLIIGERINSSPHLLAKLKTLGLSIFSNISYRRFPYTYKSSYHYDRNRLFPDLHKIPIGYNRNVERTRLMSNYP